MQRILMVASDTQPSANRAAILATTKVDVVLCDPSELVTHLGTETFDLVILCHSLRADACRAAVANSRRRWPEARILRICKYPGDVPALEFGVDAITTPESVLLLEQVRKLLANPRGSPVGQLTPTQLSPAAREGMNPGARTF